jgi:uncharacterized membrane protein
MDPRKSQKHQRGIMEAQITLILIAVAAIVYFWGEYQYNRGKSAGQFLGVLTIINYLYKKKVLGIRDNGDTYHLNSDGTEADKLWDKGGFKK